MKKPFFSNDTLVKKNTPQGRKEGLLSGAASTGKCVISILSGVLAFDAFLLGSANAAFVINDTGLLASTGAVTTLAGSSGGGGVIASNNAVALVGDGDCSIFTGDGTYDGVYGAGSNTYLGGMYGFGAQTTGADYAATTNSGSSFGGNDGFISFKDPAQDAQVFGNVSYGAKSTQSSNQTRAYGYNSFAVGCNSRALGVASTAIGLNNQANGTGSIGMGQSSIADAGGSIAMRVSAAATATDTIALGSLTVASVRNAMAIGSNAQAIAISATALGSTANDSTAKGVLASGVGSVAIGGNTIQGSSASGDNSIAISGESSASGTSAIAIGRGSAVTKNASIAIGDGAKTTIIGGVAIGSTSVASVEAGGVGFNSFSNAASTITGGAWVSTIASVSVGNGATITRQITGLAAGTNDTDAVNIAQLKQMRNYAAQGWNLSVGTNASSNVGIASEVNFSAGSSNLTASKASTGNGVVYDLAQNIAVTSVATGSSKLTTDGLAITVGTGSTKLTGTGLAIASGPSITTTGIDAASKKATNLANATLSIDSTDAVTGRQLNETNSNLDTTNANLAITNGNLISLGNRVNIRATNVNNSLGSGDVMIGILPNFSIQGTIRTNVAAAFTAVDSAITLNKTNITTNTTNITDLKTNALQYSGGVFVATRDGASQRITGVASGTASSDAVNKSQLDTAISGSAWNLSAGGTNKKAIANGNTVDFSAGSSGNLLVSKGVGNSNVSFELAQNIAVTSVTAGSSKLTTDGLAITVGTGSTKLTDTGLAIEGGPSVTTTGIDAASKKATNLADATLSTESTDAVTGKQLNETNTSLNTTNTNLATTNSNVTSLGSKVNTHATNINKALGSGDITTGEAPSFSIQDANYGSVHSAFGAVDISLNSIKGQINSIDTDALKWDTTIGAFNAARDNGSGEKVASKITNVASGELSETSTDVINGSQLFSTNERMASIANITSKHLAVVPILLMA